MKETRERKTPSMLLIEMRNGGEEIDQIIRRRLQAGGSVRAIAAEFGIHFVQLYDWMAEFQIPVPTRSRRDYGITEEKAHA